MATPESSTSIHLSWKQPGLDDRNGRIAGYRIRYYLLLNGSDNKTIEVNNSSHDFNGLEKYTIYCFEVAARSHFTPMDSRDVYGPNSQPPMCNRTKEDGNVNMFRLSFRIISIDTTSVWL